MEQISLKWLGKVLKTKILGNNDNIIINDISTNTRTIKKGNLFIALKGENFNGNDFIDEAFKKGAIGAIVQKNGRKDKKEFNNFFLFKVEDTLSTLHKIAKAYRQERMLTMVNITGSNGKTTTKEMTYSVLSTTFKTYKTNANFNNEIGVPTAVLSLDNTYDAAVLELGMTHKGDINKLIKITSPRIRILTNIGPAHLKNFSSIIDIAIAKAEIFGCYKKKDIAVFNIDDKLVEKMGTDFPGEKITFGLSPKAIIRAQEIENNGFTLVIKNKIIGRIYLSMIGKHNIYNALAAAGTGIAMDIAPEKIIEGLNSFSPPPGRMELIKFEGLWIINDAYNANPVSMLNALETFSEIETNKQRILILGDMLELGEKEAEFHKEIGKHVSSKNINYLFTCGTLASYIAKSAIEAGMPNARIFICNSAEEIVPKLKKILSGNDFILFKGSRAMKMEKIIEYLKQNYR